ncbi:uncharacterized protein LOC143253266 isoform X3 [Tachypleus tridentatus]|uniref:uncharacterized protein LOC143253266 isoform X3 n=1 Tax=Tachypleus tridentatus TaxID=6853 RepID=UPI003FD48414
MLSVYINYCNLFHWTWINMGRGKKRLKNQDTNKTVQKLFLESPFSIKWPEISVEDEPVIINAIEKSELVFGVNAVTRATEKNDLVAVLVTNSVKPPELSWHLVPLCASRGTPIICLKELNTSVSKLFNIHSLVALGLKTCVQKGESIFRDLYELINEKAPPVVLPFNQLYEEIISAEKMESDDSLLEKMASENSEKTKHAFQTFSVQSGNVAPTFISLSRNEDSTLTFLTDNKWFFNCEAPLEMDNLLIRVISHGEIENVLFSEKSQEQSLEILNTAKNIFFPTKLKYAVFSGKVKIKKRKKK